MPRDPTAVRQEFDPIVNQSVFGRVDLGHGVSQCLSQPRMIVVERGDRSSAVIANMQMFFNAFRLTFAQESENVVLDLARFGVSTPQV